jgi:purine-nucleoside phosphorylase
MIPTPHIEVKDQGVIAKVVLMPGDPLRAKFIADNFLEDVVQFNTVRNMFGYTGTYKGERISVMGSGMGMPSIGIYSYELFAFYGVEKIIRVGSCGAYSDKLKLYDVIIVKDAYSESTFGKVAYGDDRSIIPSSKELTEELLEIAKRLGIKAHYERIHSSDVFYHHSDFKFTDLVVKYNCMAVEMESFALFHNANYFKKQAACLLTVSDSLVTNEATTSQERQMAFDQMMRIALEVTK